MSYLEPPEKFFDIRTSDTQHNPYLITACAGYELGKWREKQLAEYLIEWLPEFCLKYTEIKSLGSNNAVRLLKKLHLTYTQQKNLKIAVRLVKLSCMLLLDMNLIQYR